MVANLNPKFWSKVDKNGPTPKHRPELGPCWVWTAFKFKGYGRFTANDKTYLSHRYAWTQLVGPIPDGLQVDHLCFNQSCVNPAHLEPVTPLENTRRAWNHHKPGRQTREHTHHHGRTQEPGEYCLRGHRLDESNIYRKPGTGKRQCRICKRTGDRDYRARKSAEKMRETGVSEDDLNEITAAIKSEVEMSGGALGGTHPTTFAVHVIGSLEDAGFKIVKKEWFNAAMGVISHHPLNADDEPDIYGSD